MASNTVFVYQGWRAARRRILQMRTALPGMPAISILLGPAGCGKTLLLKRLGMAFRNDGANVLQLRDDLIPPVEADDIVLIDDADKVDPAMLATWLEHPQCFSVLAAETAFSNHMVDLLVPFVFIRMEPLTSAEVVEFVSARLAKSATSEVARARCALLSERDDLYPMSLDAAINAALAEADVDTGIPAVAEPAAVELPPLARGAPASVSSAPAPELALQSLFGAAPQRASDPSLAAVLRAAERAPSRTITTVPAGRGYWGIAALAGATVALGAIFLTLAPRRFDPSESTDVPTAAMQSPIPAAPRVAVEAPVDAPARLAAIPPVALAARSQVVVEINGLSVAPAEMEAASSEGGAPGLVLLAQFGDTLPAMYQRIYAGVTPPDYTRVAELNATQIRAGSPVIFPAPPGGWNRR